MTHDRYRDAQQIRKYGMVLEVDRATSYRLGQIRQKNTSAEVKVRRILNELGFRFRLSNKDLPGSPDIANRSRRWAIFVQGCFWHNHEGCRRATIPKRNRVFWVEKFRANRERDARAKAALVDKGYKAIEVWECETDEPDVLARRLIDLLQAWDSNR